MYRLSLIILTLFCLQLQAQSSILLEADSLYLRGNFTKAIDVYKKQTADMVITTEKDSVKLQNKKDLSGIPMYYLKMDLKLEDEFYKCLLVSLADIQKHA